MKTLKKILGSQRGYSLVEFMVVASIGVIILGAVAHLFTTQQSVLQDENDNTKVRAKGRIAIKQLAKEIRMAGYGLPSNQAITAMNTNSISFRSNLDDIRTSTPPSNTAGTVAAAIGDTTITVIAGSAFGSSGNIIIYDPGFEVSEENTVTGSSSTSISLGTALTKDFIYGANTRLVTVNKYNEVTITLSGTEIVKTVDGTDVILIGDVVSGTGLQFDYNGAATIADVRKISIIVNMVDPTNSAAVIEFKTDVNLRSSST